MSHQKAFHGGTISSGGLVISWLAPVCAGSVSQARLRLGLTGYGTAPGGAEGWDPENGSFCSQVSCPVEQGVWACRWGWDGVLNWGHPGTGMEVVTAVWIQWYLECWTAPSMISATGRMPRKLSPGFRALQGACQADWWSLGLVLLSLFPGKCRKSNLLLLKKVASATGMFPYHRPSAAKYCPAVCMLVLMDANNLTLF